MSEIWSIPFPTNQGPKNTFLGRLRNLTPNLTAYIFGTKKRYRQSVKCVDNRNGSPISSQNVMNFDPQTASNSTYMFTHPPQILHSTSLPGFADGDQQTKLNETLPNGGR